MPRDLHYQLPNKKLRSGKDIVEQLKKLEREFITAQLPQFIPFNSTYIVITTAIDDAVKRKAFNDPAAVVRLELAFAYIYFEAISQFAAGDGLPGRWQPVRWQHLPASISLMFGARAHITQDLAPALKESITDTKAFAADFELINRVLIAGNPDILKSYHEPNTILNFLKNRLSFTYQPLAMYVIMHWRKRAWKEFIC
jgi:hypothetical protein